jgi:hypothetical protein
MSRRCLEPKNKDFKHYGGRGITVCERWRTYENFLADMGTKPAGMTLDRINNDGGYEPSNCRWVSHAEQMRNRGFCRRLTIFGRTMIASEWAREAGMTVSQLFNRLYAGWKPEDAVTFPIKRGVRYERRYPPEQLPDDEDEDEDEEPIPNQP